MNDPREPGPRDPAAERPRKQWGSLCEDCAHVRANRSAKGSTFLMCRLGVEDESWPKYPPQPVLRCPRFEPLAPAR